jgi:hypothetical protein
MPYRLVEGWKVGEPAIQVWQSSDKPIVFAGDLHYGYKRTDRFGVKKFIELITFVKASDAKLVLMGDMLEMSIPSHMPHAGVMFQQSITPREQRRELTAMLEPIQENIVCILSGNHEKRAGRRTSEDPIDIMCDDLDVPFVPISAFLRIHIDGKDQTYDGYVRHGYGGSQNPKHELRKEIERRQLDVDFVGLAHIHQLYAEPWRGRRVGKDGNVEEMFRWGFRTGGFLKDPAYAIEHGFAHSDVGYILTTFSGNKHEMQVKPVRMDMV